MAGTTVNVIPEVQGGLNPPSMLRQVVIEHNKTVTDLEVIRAGTINQVNAQFAPDGVVGGSYAFSAGAAPTLAASGWVKYRIAGVEYATEMPATITLEDLGNVTQGNFSAWRIEIDRAGAVTAKASPTVGGYASAQIALLALGGLAPTASAVTLGYLTLTDSDSAINVGTDNLNAAGVTSAIYYERGPRKRISGLNAALGAASTLTAASTTYGHGTIDINQNGVKKTQIAAGATQALTDADTIATVKWGAVLVVTDLAGTGKVTLNAAGTPGVTAMSYASAAAALSAANNVVDRLPAMFVPIALIRVANGSGSTFTFKTTNWDAASITSTITDATVTGYGTATSGFDSHQITTPTTSVDTAGDLAAAALAIDGTVIST